MSDYHKAHPDYAAMGIFAGYGECDDRYNDDCSHTSIVSISEAKCQCMDCLSVWEKDKDFVSDWPECDRG